MRFIEWFASKYLISVLIARLVFLNLFQCSKLQFTEINDENDLQVGESINKKYDMGGMDEGSHEEGSKNMYHGHHGEKASGYGHQKHSMEKDRLDKGKAGHQLHHHGAHHKEIGQAVQHEEGKERKNQDKVLKHVWDRGGGFVKKWYWNKGGHLEEEKYDAEKKHLAHAGKHHHKEAAQKSKGKKANHHHHKEGHKKQLHEASHGQEKKLVSNQAKDAAHHAKGGKRQSYLEHDYPGKYGHDFYDHGGGYHQPFASQGIGKYLRSDLGKNDLSGEFLHGSQNIFARNLGSGQLNLMNRSAMQEKLFPKTWRYGHIFGNGLNFLQPFSRS